MLTSNPSLLAAYKDMTSAAKNDTKTNQLVETYDEITLGNFFLHTIS